jgi:hypothetical protein
VLTTALHASFNENNSAYARQSLLFAGDVSDVPSATLMDGNLITACSLYNEQFRSCIEVLSETLVQEKQREGTDGDQL